jgi:hypothetical protein
VGGQPRRPSFLAVDFEAPANEVGSKVIHVHSGVWFVLLLRLSLAEGEVQQVFGGSALGNIASQLGISQGQASSAMAQILPELVNKLTPGGKLPENSGDLISQGLALLRGGGV